MSLAVLKSRALAGMEAPEVNVEVHLANGLPAFTIVGLPETEVKEARDRVRAAIQNGGFEMPAQRITVNLAPADLPKESGRFDLAIALGILAASRQIPSCQLDQYEYVGELSLSGELRPVRGVLAMSLAARRSAAQRAFIVPQANADEAALVRGARIHPASCLLQVCAHFAAASESALLVPHQCSVPQGDHEYPDFADVKGQLEVKRVLEIAAAGNHSVLLVGPPGAGKTMLASRFGGLLPSMTDDEALEAAALQSLTGTFDVARWRQRPFRAPHHTASGVSLVGGGSIPRPGEISLAHGGVLFLDELPEFDRHVLEVLREPLESGRITIARAARHADFPARFQLIAAMNPCPCGYHGHPVRGCRCTPDQIQRYQSRVSGPLLDRIDMRIAVAPICADVLSAVADGDSSATIRARVQQAAERQLQRQVKSNQALTPSEIDRYCKLDVAGDRRLRESMVQFQWSGRAYHRVLRVARTIADLDGARRIALGHVGEAIQYRRALPDL